MARTSTYLGSPKVIAAGSIQTLTWPSSEIDSTGVIGFYVALQGAGNDLADLDRVRVRAAGQVVFEATMAQLGAFQAAFSRSNTRDAAALTSFYIPMNLLDAPTMEAADQCQFPPGAEAQVELVTLATVAAGTAILGYTITNQVPKFFQRLYTSQSNIPASTLNGKFMFSDAGMVRALGFPTATVNRAELTISGQRAWNLPSTLFQTLTYGSLLVEKDTAEQGPLDTGGVRYVSSPLMLPAASGSSNLILDTGVGWAAANEISVYSIDRVENFRGRG